MKLTLQQQSRSIWHWGRSSSLAVTQFCCLWKDFTLPRSLLRVTHAEGETGYAKCDAAVCKGLLPQPDLQTLILIVCVTSYQTITVLVTQLCKLPQNSSARASFNETHDNVCLNQLRVMTDGRATWENMFCKKDFFPKWWIFPLDPSTSKFSETEFWV